MLGVDLFAGCGGAALGAHRAGVDHVAVVEWSAAEVLTLRSAIGDGLFARPHPAWGAATPGLVRAMDVREWAPVEADLWWASPPCTPWSSAGERLGKDDPRNGWPWVLDLLDRGPMPTWVVTENVPGLLHHSKDHEQCAACYWADEILPAMRARFVAVSVFTLNAADFGVPQTRRRVFLVAGPVTVDPPAPTHARGGAGGLLPWVSMGEALGLVGGVLQTGHRTSGPDGTRPMHEVSTDRPAPTMRVGNRTDRDITDEPAPTVACHDGSGGPWVVESQGGLPQSQRTLDPAKPATTLDAGATGGGFRAPHVAERPDWWHRASQPSQPSRTIGSKANASIALLDAPSPCVTASEVKGAAMSSDGVRTSQGGLQRASDALQLGAGRRRLTVAECLILQGLPADWPLHGNETDRYRQVGNCVPPPLAEAVVRQVVAAHARLRGAA